MLKPDKRTCPHGLTGLTTEFLVLEPALGGLISPSLPDSLCGLQSLSLLFQRIRLACCANGTHTHLL
jgi:hypothetical protein